MKYLETKHEKNSAKITTLIILILILLLFVIGPLYQDPPPEYGVAVNFGNSNVGSGNTQPDKPVKSQDLNINKTPQEANSEPEETKQNESEADAVEEKAKKQEVSEKVLTQQTEEAIKIKKEKEAKAKTEKRAKAKAKAAAKAKEAAEAKKRKEEADKKKKLDEMMGGLNNSKGESSGSEGNDNKAGDKGQLNGNPYATSYFGGPGAGNGGVGYGLNGRGQPTKKVFKQDCNESGLVVVRIEVDRSGRVVNAQPGVKGTNNTASCLLEPAKKIALSHKWKADSKAPAKQVGFVSVNFKLGQ